MDVVGGAVGIASLGMQVCQGLLRYYEDWKGYNQDVKSTYDSIDELSRSLILLIPFLRDSRLEQDKRDKVQSSVRSCEDALGQLSKKLQKVQSSSVPQGWRQKAWAEVQRASYPFRTSTLANLRELVVDSRRRLQLAIDILQLDVQIKSHGVLTQVAADTKGIGTDTKGIAVDTKVIAAGTKDLTASVAHVSTQNQRIMDAQTSDKWIKIVDWLSPPDPQTNHDTARRHHEAETGKWLLHSDAYVRWKSGASKHLWFHGGAGCGKTILCFTVIEDIQAYCQSAPNAGHARFYFSFSDARKQSAKDMLFSLVAQLCWQEPGLSTLQHAREKTSGGVPGSDGLEKILVSSICSFDDVFIMLDALDESPEADDSRRDVLDLLDRLTQGAPNLKIFATSRPERSIDESMGGLGAESLAANIRAVDADIRLYVSHELSRGREWQRWNKATKEMVEGTLATKADGMFRWAFCQLQELKRLRSTRPSHIKAALEKLPRTLDETYERMLCNIDDVCRKDAVNLLRWLAYAEKPPTLAELAHVAVIDLDEDDPVKLDDLGGVEDTLDILAGLIITIKKYDELDGDARELSYGTDSVSEYEDEEFSHADSQHLDAVNGNTMVRLAHFSVKEYLESDRIVSSQAKDFAFEPGREHGILSKSCVTYLLHYHGDREKTLSEKDLVRLPLLLYAAKSWYLHCRRKQSGPLDAEVRLLCDENAKSDWLQVHDPDYRWQGAFHHRGTDEGHGSSLYYASYTGLDPLVDLFLQASVDVNAQGGGYSNALQAASRFGYESIVQKLLDAGADVNAQGRNFSNALQAALYQGNESIVQKLLDAGADVNAQGGHYGNALQAASRFGHESTIQKLLDAGADVNAQGGHYSNALQAASRFGHESIVQKLLDAGADVHAPERRASAP